MNRNDKDFIIQKIRTQYTEKEHTELDALKALDSKVKLPANIFGYTFGSLGAVIMGAGMSFVMSELGTKLGMQAPLVPGIIIGIIGLTMAILNYPIYNKILSVRKKKYADEIISISDKIINNKE